MSKKNKDLDFEINLMPVLSIISICICYLLSMSVWNKMGMITVQQAIGDMLPESGINPDSLLVKIRKSGSVEVHFKDGENKSQEQPLVLSPAQGGQVDFEKFKARFSDYLLSHKDAKTVLVMPELSIAYGQTIKVMDLIKSNDLSVGLAPAVSDEVL